MAVVEGIRIDLALPITDRESRNVWLATKNPDAKDCEQPEGVWGRYSSQLTYAILHDDFDIILTVEENFDLQGADGLFVAVTPTQPSWVGRPHGQELSSGELVFHIGAAALKAARKHRLRWYPCWRMDASLVSDSMPQISNYTCTKASLRYVWELGFRMYSRSMTVLVSKFVGSEGVDPNQWRDKVKSDRDWPKIIRDAFQGLNDAYPCIFEFCHRDVGKQMKTNKRSRLGQGGKPRTTPSKKNSPSYSVRLAPSHVALQSAPLTDLHRPDNSAEAGNSTSTLVANPQPPPASAVGSPATRNEGQQGSVGACSVTETGADTFTPSDNVPPLSLPSGNRPVEADMVQKPVKKPRIAAVVVPDSVESDGAKVISASDTALEHAEVSRKSDPVVIDIEEWDRLREKKPTPQEGTESVGKVVDDPKAELVYDLDLALEREEVFKEHKLAVIEMKMKDRLRNRKQRQRNLVDLDGSVVDIKDEGPIKVEED